MRSIIGMAFRNIFRQKRRTFLLGISIVLGTFVLILGLSFVDGIQKQLFENMLVQQTGHFVVHHESHPVDSSPMAKPDTDLDHALSDDAALEKEIAGMPGIERVIKQTTFAGSLANESGVSAVTVIGQSGMNGEPLADIVNATAASSDPKSEGLYLPKSLSEELDLSVGDEVTLFVRNDAGEMRQELFAVKGVFDSVAPWLSSNAYISLERAQQMLGSEGKSMEWLVYGEKSADLAALEAALDSKTAAKSGWQVATAEEAGGFYAGATLGFKALLIVNLSLIFIVVAMGMTNLMLMASLERTKEIGTLLALGTPRAKVAWLLILEALIIALLATAVSAVLGVATVSWLGSVGIDLQVEAMKYSIGGTKVYPVLSVTNLLLTLGVVTVVIFLAALYPAVKACRWSPIRALRGQY
ncbi:FtsX-like permease family protein [Tumebacillus sp. DT12]|uniref:FtsX-like permease family protein n=1 Tax=Tumebacillus lacus TaxID=2995335 RepID=A0ABT3X4F9_9BACL|nr:FtsX-like permease family protein [Tumebacillus lacus]MCX7571786.1 FtsX-like permease family protein [Tumebacillus lacus]